MRTGNDSNFKHFASQYLERKFGCMSHRCPDCWHERVRCICHEIVSPIAFRDNLNFIVYMDYKEVYNAGDDAKIMQCYCSRQSKRFIYPIEDDLLIDFVRKLAQPSTVIVLFPSKDAITVKNFLDIKPGSEYLGKRVYDEQNVLNIIVIDGVWRHARRMAQRLRELFPNVTFVKLSPEQLSVYARTQTQPDRISSIEALALFLNQIGEDPNSCNRLISCVEMNNRALRGKITARKQQKIYYSKLDRHPAWYFDNRYCGHL